MFGFIWRFVKTCARKHFARNSDALSREDYTAWRVEADQVEIGQSGKDVTKVR
jgi:hypothetical protein